MAVSYTHLMAAARQKEMNVSITEDATMSRTRSVGGATVVRVDAIVKMPARPPAFCKIPASETTALRRVYPRIEAESTEMERW